MILVADSKIPHAETAFREFGDVRVIPTKLMNRESVKDAGAVLVRSETRIDSSFLSGTAVRFVGTATIGTDHIDLDYLAQNNIGFASCPGSNANSVAEYILAALLEVSARFGRSLNGSTLGVVGHGNTGSRVARKAEAVGMRVLLNDPPLARLTGDPRYVSLDALMEADFISLHVPLTKTGEDPAFHLFDGRRMLAMKQGSILLNASRGAVVDNQALKKLLVDQHLEACVLDVWEGEPMIDGDLLRLVTLGSPHIAGYSHDGKLNATIMLREALGTFLRVPLSDTVVLESVGRRDIHILSHADTELALREAVKQCYDIEQDDARLRQILGLPLERRGDYFRELRSKYPHRREFHNYVVNINPISNESARVLAAVGFSLD